MSNSPVGHNSRNGHDARPRSRDGHASPRPVLITGGAGFIGTNVAASFLAEGRPVTIFDNLSRPGVEQNLAWLMQKYTPLVQHLHADITDAVAVEQAVAGASCVFHFSAQVAVTTSLLNPRFDFDVNAMGTLNVLEACRLASPAPPLLFTSTNKVYGSLDSLPLARHGKRYVPMEERIRQLGIDESQPLDFHSPYGCSKGAADQYVLDYAKCFDLPAVVFRMSCIYGPHQHGTEDQGWAAHFVRQIINERPITFYGNGCQVRDMLFVGDLVRAMRLATERIDITRGHAFNMGGGPANAISVREVVEALVKVNRTSPTVHRSQWRPGDQRYYVSNTRRFEQLTGWTAEVDVSDGLSILNRWLGDREAERSGESVRTSTSGQAKQKVPRSSRPPSRGASVMAATP